MAFQHKQLADGGWVKLSFFEQMANVGSEIERTISWKNKNNPDYSRQAFFRGLELIDLTISDVKNQSRLREITKTREALVDYFIYDNEYHSNNKQWQNYFNYFLWKVRGS